MDAECLFSGMFVQLGKHEIYTFNSAEAINENLEHNGLEVTSKLFLDFSKHSSVGDTFFRINSEIKIAITRVN